MLLQDNGSRLITINKTHKDRNTSRRRKGWAYCNSGGATIKEWYTNVVCYTVIAAADINSFIPSACNTILGDGISEEEAVGTINAEDFLYWVDNYLCPVLGRYKYRETRLVVLIDNTSCKFHHKKRCCHDLKITILTFS